MKRGLLLSISCIVVLISPLLHAAQSTITDAEGYTCMGADKSRRQTEQTVFLAALKGNHASFRIFRV